MLFRVIFSLFFINEPLLLSRTGGFEDIVDFLKTTFTEMSVIQLERILAKVFSLDLSIELHRYAVEYDIYKEEQDISPAHVVHNLATMQECSSTSSPNSPTESKSSESTDKTVEKELAMAKRQIVELRAEKMEMMSRIETMKQRLQESDSEQHRLETTNKALLKENTKLRSKLNGSINK